VRTRATNSIVSFSWRCCGIRYTYEIPSSLIASVSHLIVRGKYEENFRCHIEDIVCDGSVIEVEVVIEMAFVGGDAVFIFGGGAGSRGNFSPSAAAGSSEWQPSPVWYSLQSKVCSLQLHYTCSIQRRLFADSLSSQVRNHLGDNSSLVPRSVVTGAWHH
jgi:hypothetical protein